MSEPPLFSSLYRSSADIVHLRISSSLGRFEILVRSILMRQDHPAVLLLGHFSPQVQREHGFASPDHWHNVVAQFYDIPHIRCGPWECIVDPRFTPIFFGLAQSQSFTLLSWRNNHLSIGTLPMLSWPTRRVMTSWQMS